MFDISKQIADELSVKSQQVKAAVDLLDEGATVPFVARYRKEVTGGLDDTQLRTLEERLNYLRELEDRRAVILKSITDQEKLTDELEASIKAAATKTELEDLYLPYKPKRRTKAQIAREAGLEPLALALLEDANLVPEQQAEGYLNEEHNIGDTKAALDGARQILMEKFSEDALLLGKLRDYLWDNGFIRSSVVEGKEQEGRKFSDYFEYSEALNKIPSHRALAILRGRNEGVLSIQLVPSAELLEDEKASNPCQYMIAEHFNIKNENRAADSWLQLVVQWTWRIKLHMHFETELVGRIRENSENDAINVFANNLRDLLMAAPAGSKVTMGLDPGLRTGVKVVVVDDTGKLLTHTTIFPHAPQNQWDQSLRKLKTLCEMHKVNLVSIGNGTASRETDKLVTELQKSSPELKLERIMVSEAGASVYSASELAALEFPDLDVSFRGAVSIARRLQDPLAELVKIEPKSIGVGQYQHDVSQSQLSRTLGAVVEDCVNAVGVDLNMASGPLLARVSGLNKTLAANIVRHREEHGRFKNRKQLLDVERLGPKAFEQAAGFLRIIDGDNALDASTVHPEAYPVVENILESLNNKPVKDVMGNTDVIRKLMPEKFVTEQFGVPTITDILKELEKPGRDPRGEFKMARFKEGVETMADLKEGMELEGAVTNVTDFGAFVDIGVHQDGLVHISVMSKNFISNPREVVKAGDIVRVHVTEVDLQRKRIGLSMIGPNPDQQGGGQKASQKPSGGGRRHQGGGKQRSQKSNSGPSGALGMALADALKKSK
ncbi:Tex family protein [Pleionea sp. CnH1-48]|uniref:Tex family protein n=1 Tax=Pleionea sp. CnH1-48 TaxID=2954494 RepID=UPI00209844DF|nr:Tex family protein [Pleionea sp. CnH1-48]MCO7226218.1 RNA-binding transcriptional accessory protein [Pleionea sp. CnH1-48]